MDKTTIKVSTNRTPKELITKAREAYERLQVLKAQQSGDSPSEGEMEHETPADDDTKQDETSKGGEDEAQ